MIRNKGNMWFWNGPVLSQKTIQKIESAENSVTFKEITQEPLFTCRGGVIVLLCNTVPAQKVNFLHNILTSRNLPSASCFFLELHKERKIKITYSY